MKSFNIGDQIKATISCFNSLKGFYLKRIYEDDPDDQLSKRLYQQINHEYHNHNYSIIAPEENLPVAALYQDNNWYRAEITKIYPMETKVEVFFVDYGETYTLDCSQVCYLQYEFLASEVSTFKCRLFGVEFQTELDYENANDYVHQIIDNLTRSDNKTVDIIIKNVLQETRSKIYEVIVRYQIEEKLENLNIMLTKLCYAQCTNLSIYDGEKETVKVKDKHILKREPRMTRLEKSVQKMALHSTKTQNFKPQNSVLSKVLNADSPDELWIQDVVDSDKIYAEFCSRLNQHYTSLSNNEYFNKIKNDWNLNDICVLKMPNRNEFHRARIIEKSGSKYKLICGDIGLNEIANESNLFELDEEFVQPDFMAKCCFISGIIPTGTSDGQWSCLAREFTTASLKDQYVYVDFLNHVDNKYEVCIYLNASRKLGLGNETGEEKYVKFSDVLNTEGLALISGKNKIIDRVITESNLLSKCGQIGTGCYGFPDLPNKVYKNFQNNFQVFYDCLITEVGFTDNLYYVWAMFPTIVNSLETFKQMSDTFEVFYDKNSANFDSGYLTNAIKNSKLEACVCKFESKYYRGEILSLDNQQNTSEENFIVRLIDTGRVESICANSIFKPLEKYIQVDRLVYQIFLDTDETIFNDKVIFLT